MNHLKVFGSVAYLQTPKSRRKKLDFKASPYIFVGYTDTQDNYKFVDPQNPRKLVLSRDATFMEHLNIKNLSFQANRTEVVELENFEEDKNHHTLSDPNSPNRQDSDHEENDEERSNESPLNSSSS